MAGGKITECVIEQAVKRLTLENENQKQVLLNFNNEPFREQQT